MPDACGQPCDSPPGTSLDGLAVEARRTASPRSPVDGVSQRPGSAGAPRRRCASSSTRFAAPAPRWRDTGAAPSSDAEPDRDRHGSGSAGGAGRPDLRRRAAGVASKATAGRSTADAIIPGVPPDDRITTRSPPGLKCFPMVPDPANLRCAGIRFAGTVSRRVRCRDSRAADPLPVSPTPKSTCSRDLSRRSRFSGPLHVGLAAGRLSGRGRQPRVVRGRRTKPRSKTLKRGIPIYETGWTKSSGAPAAGTRITTEAAAGVAHGLFPVHRCRTPPDEGRGSDRYQRVRPSPARSASITDYRIIVNKSTVPVAHGRCRACDGARAVGAAPGRNRLDGFQTGIPWKEGAAVDDFMKPDRIVIGTDDPRATGTVARAVMNPSNRSHGRLVEMDVRSAELTKYRRQRHAGDQDQLHE